jgi:adenosylcobinamide-GDP ribazoletransferase
MFFTRIPCPVRFEYQPEFAGHAAKYLPLIGILIGTASAVAFWLAQWIFPQSVAVLLSLIVSVLLTGGFHEDGFADACDGFGGGLTREDVLRIMQDSRVGAFGAIGIALLLLLKFEALSALKTAMVPIALILAHAISRLAAVSLVQTLPYLRQEGEGKCHGVARPMSGNGLVFALLVGSLPLFWLDVEVGAWVLAMVGVSRLAIGHYFSRRLGGYTGDCLGAAQQVTEVVVYLCLLGAWGF